MNDYLFTVLTGVAYRMEQHNLRSIPHVVALLHDNHHALKSLNQFDPDLMLNGVFFTSYGD